jgi:hypothetical protein
LWSFLARGGARRPAPRPRPPPPPPPPPPPAGTIGEAGVFAAVVLAVVTAVLQIA